MSRRQRCVWGCNNRKGRCAEDITGNRLCGCPELEVKDCPKRHLLTLHSINSMPEHVKRAVVHKINLTRKDPKGRKWKPSKDAVICNVHYADYKGPSSENRELIPTNFKRPHHFAKPPPAKIRCLLVSAQSKESNELLAAEGLGTLQVGGLENLQAGRSGTLQGEGSGTLQAEGSGNLQAEGSGTLQAEGSGTLQAEGLGTLQAGGLDTLLDGRLSVPPTRNVSVTLTQAL